MIHQQILAPVLPLTDEQEAELSHLKRRIIEANLRGDAASVEALLVEHDRLYAETTARPIVPGELF